MIVPALTYIIFAISGLIGSAIAWEDLRNAGQKPAEKNS